MKALTVQNPSAMQIWGGRKTVEHRTWNTDYRGDILITSSSKKVRNCVCGYALCVVRLADVVPFTKEHVIPAGYLPSNASAVMIDRYPFMDGYAWILEDVRPIKPFPIKGKLNLWNADIEEDKLEFMRRWPEDGATEAEEDAWVKEYIEPLRHAPFPPLLPRNR